MATPPDFTAGSVLTAAQMNAVGLWKVADQTISASSFAINGCFTSDYDHYLVTMTYYGSNSSNANLRVRSGTSTPETGAVYDRYGPYWSGGAWANFDAANQTSAFLNNHNSTSTTPTLGSIWIYNPNKAAETAIFESIIDSTGLFVNLWHRIQTSTVYTGLEIYNATAGQTLTGSVRVYGFRN